MDNKLEDYHLIVESGDLQEIQQITEQLKWFIQHQHDVPYLLIQRFLQLLDDEENFEYRSLDAESRNKAAIAEKRLAALRSTTGKRKLYAFDYTETDGKKIAFKDVLRISILAYLKAARDVEPQSKKEVMRFFFEAINDCFKPLANDEEQKKINKYTTYVIVGVLTEVCWSRIVTSDKQNAAGYRNAVRNALER